MFLLFIKRNAYKVGCNILKIHATGIFILSPIMPNKDTEISFNERNLKSVTPNNIQFSRLLVF